jgi:hypothetical protein
MSSADLRQTFDEATAALDGDKAPVRKLVFDLAGQLRDTRTRLEEAAREAGSLRERLAVLQARADDLSAVVDGQRQRLDGLEVRCRRAEQIAAAAAGEKVAVSRSKALQAIERLRPAFSAAAVGSMDARRRQTLAYTLAVDPADLAALSDLDVRGLFHLGFSDYHLLMTLTGAGNKFLYRIIP